MKLCHYADLGLFLSMSKKEFATFCKQLSSDEMENANAREILSIFKCENNRVPTSSYCVTHKKPRVLLRVFRTVDRELGSHREYIFLGCPKSFCDGAISNIVGQKE